MRDTLKKTDGVKSVEINKSKRMATVVLETETITVDDLLQVLAQGWNGRYRAEVKETKSLK